MEIFISYASADVECATFLQEILEDELWSVWRDARSLVPSDIFPDKIETALANAGCIIVLWSKHSRDSKWVRTEAQRGLTLAKLVPVSIDGTVPPRNHAKIHYTNFVGWEEIVDIDISCESDEALESIVAGTRAVLGEENIKDLLYWYARAHEGWWLVPSAIKEDASLYMRFEPISRRRVTHIREALEELVNEGWLLEDSGKYAYIE